MPVTAVHVDDEGVRAHSEDEVVLDVLFDDRRIWSFHLHRDGKPRGDDRLVAWPAALRPFLDGTTRVSVVEHLDGQLVHDEEVRLGAGEGRIAVVDDDGLPLGLDKSLRLARTFDTRSASQVAPLLDAIEEVLGALAEVGVDAFLAYGSLLGAVREGRLIAHDSDADLGYVSELSHPVDVVRESFRLQRALTDLGYTIRRYSGLAFRVEVPESDGSVRGLDVFGGFLADGRLHLMGEIRTPFERDWVLPLGTATLEGRPMPVPADTDRFLTATYGPDWRVPDPAYKFDTPRSTRRRLTGWFRGTRMGRDAWEQDYERRLDPLPPVEPSDFARWVVECEDGIPERVVDIGCGRALDDLWFAREGSRVLGLDYLPQGARQALELAAEEGADLEVRMLSLGELRSVLAESARLAHEPGRRVVTVRHTADATDADSRERLWRACSMLLRASGRVYVEVLTDRGDDGFAAANRLRPVPLDEVAAGVRGRGARVVSQDTVEVRGATGSHQVGRLVATWAE